jgi:uncharacterized Ntn-hydrolase superfamily protein
VCLSASLAKLLAHQTLPHIDNEEAAVQRIVRSGVLTVLMLVLSSPLAFATWSVIAVDRDTGEVVIASATCVPQARLEGFPADDLRDIQAIVVPGVGVAAAQASVDRTRANQQLIFDELNKGTPPAEIIQMLSADPRFQSRQFGIVDVQGRGAAHSGSDNGAVSVHAVGSVDGAPITFAVQGNILADERVVHDAVDALRATSGTLADRVMAAMEAADAAGGDRRCSCESEPLPSAPCDAKTAHVAYILGADADDPSGASFNDGDYALYISVTDENIASDENANPVATLRMRYDAWRAGGRR